MAFRGWQSTTGELKPFIAIAASNGSFYPSWLNGGFYWIVFRVEHVQGGFSFCLYVLLWPVPYCMFNRLIPIDSFMVEDDMPSADNFQDYLFRPFIPHRLFL